MIHTEKVRKAEQETKMLALRLEIVAASQGECWQVSEAGRAWNTGSPRELLEGGPAEILIKPSGADSDFASRTGRIHFCHWKSHKYAVWYPSDRNLIQPLMA